MIGAKGDEDKILRAFLNGFLVSPLTPSVAEKGVELCQTHKLKLPNAIIYATAREAGCLFVTRNTKNFDDTLPDVTCALQLMKRVRIAA